MSKEKSPTSLIGPIVTSIILIAVSIPMGSFMLDFAQGWPTDFGPSPMLFVWIPYLMGGLGVLCIVGSIINYVRGDTKKPSSVVPTYTAEAEVVDPFQSRPTSGESSGYTDTTAIYDVPSYCNGCSAPLKTEEVDWVGPMSFSCPNCGKTQKAETRRL